MDWFDIRNNPNVKVITETVYRGIQLKLADGKGWKVVLGCEEYLFPHYTAAQKAVDTFHADCVQKYGAQKSVNTKA